MEASSWIGWVSLVAGVVVAASVFVMDMLAVASRRVRIVVAATAGLALVAVAAVLAALGGGRELWLTGLGGFLCLWVAATIRLRVLDIDEPLLFLRLSDMQYRSSVTALEATQDVNRLLYRLNNVVGEVERRATPMLPARATASGDFPEMADALVAQGVWAPVSVYTTADDGTPLKGAVVGVLRAFDLTVVVEEPVELGSWFQRFWTRARSDSVRDRMRKLEQAVELQYLGKARAEIDHAKALAVAALLQAISTQDNAVVRIGSLIAIKTQGDLAVWTVSELEAADMERHGALLRDPVSALEYLRRLKQDPDQLTPPPHD